MKTNIEYNSFLFCKICTKHFLYYLRKLHQGLRGLHYIGTITDRRRIYGLQVNIRSPAVFIFFIPFLIYLPVKSIGEQAENLLVTYHQDHQDRRYHQE
jgi:hypothetical protein